jgi:hypothetical protein
MLRDYGKGDPVLVRGDYKAEEEVPNSMAAAPGLTTVVETASGV